MAEKIIFNSHISDTVFSLAGKSEIPPLRKLTSKMRKYHNSMSPNLPILSIASKPAAATTTTTITITEKLTFNAHIFGRVRLATESDVQNLHALMYEMSRFLNFSNIFNATEASISKNLFTSNPCPPFYSVTSLILEVSPNPFPPTKNENSSFDPILKNVNLDSTILDSESELFRTNDEDVFVAGYVLFFPNYSGYFDKPGFFIENIYVRECYRRYGFGKMLFSAVASQAAKMGFSTVDWYTFGWNVDAIDFYLGMGAKIIPDVKRFRLSGEGLDAFAQK